MYGNRATQAALLAAALLSFAGGAHALAPTADAPQGPERLLLEEANRERAARHLSALRWNASLAQAAHEHAQLMAQHGQISHQFAGEPALSERLARAGVRFTVASENVGQAPGTQELHVMWMQSPPHRANLLDPQVDSAGFAVAVRNGQYFAVEDFARVFEMLSLGAQERQIGDLLAARGLRVLPSSSEARATCALDRGVAEGLHPKYHIRWMTADLQQMPPQLEAELRTGRYHSATVGACAPGKEAGAGAYRVVVLLY
jgi:hypothetical protein